MSPDYREAKKRSLDALQRLYGFVVSLAVAEALRRAFTSGSAVRLPTQEEGWTLAALLATVVPFFHGTNRYLDRAYFTGERPARSRAILVDFILLFAQGIIIFVLGLFISLGDRFFDALAILLILDATWIFLTELWLDKTEGKEGKFVLWTYINLPTAAIIFCAVHVPEWKPEICMYVFCGLLCVFRSIADYAFGFDFYFPHDKGLTVKDPAD